MNQLPDCGGIEEKRKQKEIEKINKTKQFKMQYFFSVPTHYYTKKCNLKFYLTLITLSVEQDIYFNIFRLTCQKANVLY